MREIELKARIIDRDSTEQKIALFADYSGKAEKSDTYWRNLQLPEAARTVRVRRQKSETPDGLRSAEHFVTCKHKQVRDGIEVNDETEFTVSDPAAFETLLRAQGYEVGFVKEKKVTSWKADGALIELCTLLELGDFIEIEILSENDGASVETCRTTLLKLLDRCGVPQSCIETAYYSELLERKNTLKAAAAKPANEVR